MKGSRWVVAASLGWIVAAGGCAIEDDSLGTTELQSHAWSSYHWGRTANPFSLITVNSLTSDWDGYLATAIDDWNASGVLNFVEDPNGDTSTRTRRKCKGDPGQIRVCNLGYGYTGWLGIAGISVDADGHIVAGYTKLNDSYFDSATYNDPTWRQMVACQEIAHNVGLDHQDETFGNPNLGTCMDYTAYPAGGVDPDDGTDYGPLSNEAPNAHDFEQLDTIYAHLDSANTYDDGMGGGDGGGDGGGCNAPPGRGCNKAGLPGWWGPSVAKNGGHEVFVRANADGSLEVTHVTWAMGHEH